MCPDPKAESSQPVIPRAVLFLCTGNSCRSQMAEGFARVLFPPGIEVYSAGISPVRVNPNAIEVMTESGIDIRSQSSKGLSSVPMDRVDTVITLCGHAEAFCPTFTGSVVRYHWPIDDPVGVRGSKTKVVRAFRKARDEIRDLIQGYIGKLGSHAR